MIRLHQVTHRYGSRLVLDRVELTLTESRVGLIGANGSGKSTLARMLNGLVLPSEGSVTVDGLDTRRHGAQIRRRVGFLFSDPDAQIVMPTVGEDVAFSLRRARLGREETDRRVRAALDRFGLGDHHDHPAHLLSSGQKQLLALASVLVTEPEVVVCDEPTTLLDRRNTRQVAELIDRLRQQVVLVTHDLTLLSGWPRVIVLDAGRVVADGPAQSALEVYREVTG